VSGRTYGQYCALAHALDLVGERWALLVVRELLVGPRRFTDLRHGLPGIGTNILTDRLKELEAAGIVERRLLPPPAASAVYELTEFGRGLEEPVLALGRWGARTLGTRDGRPLRSQWLALAVKSFTERNAQGFEAVVELRLEDGTYALRYAGGEVAVAQGHADRPDVVLETGNDTLVALLMGALDADEALASGAVRADGDAALLGRTLALARL
jgi:DNA-binding HxlR family transcriptional regulator/putative sterol carrier protein